jgi:hypothetical protein
MPALVNWDIKKAVIHFMKMKDIMNINRPDNTELFQKADQVTSDSDSKV